MSQILVATLAVSLGVMILLWLLSLYWNDASIVDAYWGLGFVILTWFTALRVGIINTTVVVIVSLVTIWGLRLSCYLYFRNRKKSEDRRYVAMREKHGSSFWWVSFLTVFGLQGLIMWFVAMPIVATIFYSQSTTDFSLFVLAGIVVWALGLFFESVGDFQMARFKADPANQGQVMNRGLWRYTRHPNYFGDFCVWWGIFLVAASTGAWWTIGSPAMMSFFLIKVSGVKLLESDIADRRPGYLEYQRETNAFFPGPPKTPQADA